MKTKHFALAMCAALILLTSGCYTMGIGGNKDPEKIATGFLINTSDDPETAYRKIAGMLSDRGYTLAATDPVLYSITTDWRELGGHSIRLRTLIRESTAGCTLQCTSISVRGDYNLSVNVGKALLGSAMRDDPSSPIEERGMRDSPARKAWVEMETFVAGYASGVVARVY